MITINMQIYDIWDIGVWEKKSYGKNIYAFYDKN